MVAAYRASYCTAGDINELDFLSRKDYLLIPSIADRYHQPVSTHF